jgi:hypothetical protein
MISTILGRQFVMSRFLLRVGLMGLVMVLLLGSVGQARSAGNYQSQRDDFSLSVWAFKLLKQNYLCTGEQMRIDVQTLYLTPVGQNKIPTPTAGLPVSAKVTGGTGTVSPQSTRTVWGPDSDSPPRTAVFNFKATKAGHEKIIFETIAPTELGEFVPSESIPAELEFDVKKCKKKVNQIFNGKYSDDAFHASELALIEDAIIEQGDDGVYRGSADLEWNVFNHALNDGSCVWQPYTVISPAEITAQPDDENESLGLTLTYADVQHSVTATCADSGTSTVDTASLLSTLGPTTATLPSSGGVTRLSQAWPGEFGTFTIIVESEEEQPVSKTDHSVAWLPGWFETALLLLAEGE